MKRVAMVDEDAKVKLKHQTLLQDYLELQKEFVAKKKKLQAANQKKEILLAEVGFLRLRQRYLLGLRSQELEPEQDLGQPQNLNIQSKMIAKDRIYGANEAVLKKSSPVLDLDPILGEEVNGRRKEEVVLEPLRVNKKPKNCLINGKRVEKKKISWQDQVALKV